MLNGIDVSKWQGKMDWAKARSAGAQFAVVRAGSIDNVTGVPYMDYEFPNNKGTASGLPVSYYWFFRPNHPAKRQAEFFLNLVQGEKRDFALWCDIEVEGKASAVLEFCELVKKAAPIGIYTNPNTVLYKLTGVKSWMATLPLWLADWTPPANVPLPFDNWAIWQYAVMANGKVYGAQSESIDHNYGREELLQIPPAPVVDLTPRVEALEKSVASFQMTVANMLAEVVKLDGRVKKLEDAWAHHDAPLQEGGKVFEVKASITTARRVSRLNKAGKPVMVIYPNDGSPISERVRFMKGVKVLLKDGEAITADGGEKYFEMVQKAGDVELYLRGVDGKVT